MACMANPGEDGSSASADGRLTGRRSVRTHLAGDVSIMDYRSWEREADAGSVYVHVCSKVCMYACVCMNVCLNLCMHLSLEVAY